MARTPDDRLILTPRAAAQTRSDPVITRLLDDAQVGRRYAEGLWDDRSLADLVDAHADARPDHTAVIDARERVTYEELCDRSRRLATVLAGLGVTEGTPVAAQLPGCVLLAALHLACVRLGALYLPLSTAWAASELRSLLTTARAPVLIVDGPTGRDGSVDLLAQAEEVRSTVPCLRAVVHARTGTDDALEALTAQAQPFDEEHHGRRAHPDAPVLVMSSSGTTGAPKAAVWGGNDLKALLLHNVGPRLAIGPDDVAAGLAPAKTGSTGYVFPVLAPLLHGATVAVLERWSPQAALDLLVREGATYATAIPTQMTMLLPLDLEAVDLSRLTRFNNAGAPLRPEVARTVEERMGCRVQTIYGSTDGGVPVMTSVDDPDEVRRRTVGSLCRGVELMLVGPDGHEVAEGEPGEVCWRGSKSWGHLGQPDNDRAAFDPHGRFRSGDLGVLDDEGRLSIVGRLKDMILRGGTNIFPAEIERLLGGHPDVAEVAVVGVPDDRLGERACAVVVPRRGAAPTLDALCTFLRGHRIAVEKLPEDLVLTDELPTNAGGKVDKAALRAGVLAGRGGTAAGEQDDAEVRR